MTEGRARQSSHVALDPSDRVQAILAWCGILVGGFVVPIVILALNWSRRDSLARSQAVIATILYAVAVVVFFPMVIWAYGFGGNKTAFWVAWGVLVVVIVGATIRGLVLSIRAPIASPAPPG